MMYPLKFDPTYKNYLWGGRELEKLGKVLPEGIIAESWEISSHPDGVSTVANGEYKGVPLSELVEKLGRDLVGKDLPEKDVEKFPLLIKLIDANDKLSVQVHPEDEYAKVNENGELGKNEMWYIVSAKPGSKLCYGLAAGVTRKDFENAVKAENIESCLNFIEVSAGDVVNIPAGFVHAIGAGIVIAEIQQNSNTTYRVYDYNRADKEGKTRPLHIEKALEVIDFREKKGNAKTTGLKINFDINSKKTHLIANKYFSVEKYEINGTVDEMADGSKFHIYVFMDGCGEIVYHAGNVKVSRGESVLIPASLGKYSLNGHFTALKTYLPDLEKDVIEPLKLVGYTEEEIFENVDGLK